MLYENADKIWDDFAQENRQEGEKLGRNKLAYEMVLKSYKKAYPNVISEKLKEKLDRMTTDQLLKSLDQIIENSFVVEEIVE